MNITQTQPGFVAAFVIGILALPVLAVAFAPSNAVPSTEDVAAGDVQAAVGLSDTEALAVPAVATQPTLDADLAVACGQAGLNLVELADAGKITPLEQAALAALRPICVEAGRELPVTPILATNDPESPTTTKPPASPPTTQPTSSTTAPPPPNTTLPQAPGPAIGEYFVDGGSVTLAFYSDRVEVVDIQTNAGWKVETEYEGPTEIDVKFETDGGKSFIFVTRPNGEWKVVTANENEDDEEGA